MALVKYILPLLFCCRPSPAKSQLDTNTIAVTKLIITGKRDALLSPTVDGYTLKEIAKALSNNMFARSITRGSIVYPDTLIVTETERLHIQNALAEIENTKWGEADVKQLGLTGFSIEDTNRSTLTTPLSNQLVYTIMPPVFIRNSTICFFYYHYHCGPLCGHGELQILKKENNNWTEWWPVYMFDN